MDRTLADILNKLYELQGENQRLAQENAHLRTVLTSGLPIVEASADDLASAEVLSASSVPNDQ